MAESEVTPQDIHEQLVRWLRQPSSYRHVPETVEYIETHISQVFLAGEFVYKLKKPVRYDFLDFSTLALREQACREELHLNRRLAKHVYVDVVSIARDSQGNFNWDGNGELVDWLVHMRRLPLDQTLEALLNKQQLTPQHIERLAARLVAFYQSLEPLAISPQDYREHFISHVQGNTAALLAAGHHLPTAMVQRTQSFQMQLLACRPELFDARVKGQRIFDGHGDLRPEHICLSEPIAIFDCIEFNADFRRIDVMDELAFLAAECDYHQAEWVGEQLFARFQALSNDHPLEILIDFYKTYRATVRAKVAALRADQLTGEASAHATREALRHMECADQYATRHVRPLMLIVGGLSGSGKTTLGRALAEQFAAELIRTDVVRQELFPADTNPSELYSKDSREQVYAEMFRRAEALHREDISIVLDATFATVASVQQARAMMSHPRAIFLAIECFCREEVARERIKKRSTQGADASQATTEVMQQQRLAWQPWPSDLPQCHIDTEQPLEQQVVQVIAKLASL